MFSYFIPCLHLPNQNWTASCRFAVFVLTHRDRSGLDSFVHFIDSELAPRKVNTLIVQIEYHYQFKSHPELTDSFALSKSDVKKIVSVCKKNNIRVIPQIDLLGHQSWANHNGKLLLVYPQFDETPDIKMPEKYVVAQSG